MKQEKSSNPTHPLSQREARDRERPRETSSGLSTDLRSSGPSKPYPSRGGRVNPRLRASGCFELRGLERDRANLAVPPYEHAHRAT